MSTMVQMPVRVKPPPADTGETISPGCASLEIATPLKGARMTVLSRFVCSSSIWRLDDAHLLARRGDPRFEGIHFGLRLVDLGCRDQLILDELHDATERELRFGQSHFALAHVAAGRFGLRLGQRQRRAKRGVVEAGEHLPFLDRHAFFDVDLDDLAR